MGLIYTNNDSPEDNFKIFLDTTITHIKNETNEVIYSLKSDNSYIDHNDNSEVLNNFYNLELLKNLLKHANNIKTNLRRVILSKKIADLPEALKTSISSLLFIKAISLPNYDFLDNFANKIEDKYGYECINDILTNKYENVDNKVISNSNRILGDDNKILKKLFVFINVVKLVQIKKSF